ncbi:MAG TPA: leucine-rich repeat domain-containing protein [Paludibacter sp.]
MKNLRLSIIMLLGIVIFTGCDDDSIFYPKVKTANGITTVSGIRAGGLEQAMLLCLGTVKHLVINDTIDSRDFETMRDDMPNLSVLDLSNATIAAYNGYEGTAGTRVYRYPANAIPEFAFYDPAKSKGKKSLASITFPKSIKSIRDYAFNRCTGLKGTLNIPVSVKDTIGKSAFSFCENLTGLTLSGVNYIGESAFQGCTALAGTLVIPDSVFTIKPWAFADCANINSISISGTVNNISAATFYNCGAVFSVDPVNTSYSSLEDVLFDFDKFTLIQFPKSKAGTYEVPSTVSTIGAYSFANCTALTAITVPSAVGTVEDYAFMGCTGLVGTFTISSGVSYIGQHVFDDCPNITAFQIAPDNITFTFADGVLVDLGQMTIKRCVQSKTGGYIVSPDISTIDNSAFSNCTMLTSVTLPEAISYIGQRAFLNCTGLTSIHMNAAAPIDMRHSATAFEGVKMGQCTLYVPIGAATNYRNAAIWKDFVDILEN